jgi:hypothetical protein
MSAITTAGERLVNPIDNVIRSVLGDDANHHPAEALHCRNPFNIPDELATVRSVLVAVVLHGDQVVLPAHVEQAHKLSVLVNRYLRGRLRKSGVEQKQPQPAFFRRCCATVYQRQHLIEPSQAAGAPVSLCEQ